ncbi:hypothetical protein BBH88_17580 [Planococcus antarcticus DSM 14505]|uniref:FAD/FMN-containing dehydrogenase n=1 Tax=Planococcus antarcticus DSM 14505 TaxID=1185653 RepID=A0ABM6D8R1_9BACL|nr:hypothetical protein [Planococcus antarcticus]ANU11932.1 hypothetical protein BBH88_17580 [Planococcus antarcticus DSM 14505]
MKKRIVSGVLTAVIIIGGGNGLYRTLASAKENAETSMQHDGMTMDHMHEMMESGNMNFGQMKPFMKKMHPDLDNQQLRELYKGMHSTGGSATSKNFKGMMGN